MSTFLQVVDRIGRAVDEHGVTDRDELARLVGARYWGPGRFSTALREAAAEGACAVSPGRRTDRANTADAGGYLFGMAPPEESA
jgi:hypothetical protein